MELSGFDRFFDHPLLHRLSLPLLVGGAVSAVLVYSLSVVIYNVFFHPLRKYPGPLLAGATHFYMAWYTIKGQRHLINDALHNKYGEVVRVAPNQLSFIGPTAWRDIYMHKQGRAQLPKVNRGKPRSGAYSIMNAPDDVHARQRKMLSHAFSDKALREQEPLFRVYVDLLMSNMHDDAREDRPVDIVAAFNFTTFDIIGDLCFAEPFHNLELRRPHPWLSSVIKGVRQMVIVNSLSLIPGLELILRTIARPLTPQRFFLLNYAKERVTQRIEQGSSRPDFMGKILPHKTEDGTGIARAEIDATVTVLILAGSETTATLLSGCVYLLLRNSSVLQKLTEEVLTAFGTKEEIDILKVNRLPYLQAVLEESLRMYPPVPVALPRLTPPEGMEVCGHWIPGSTVVGIPQRTAYRSPTNFADPLSFRPERWLANKHPKFNEDQISVFQPFSAGPRNCLGKNLAYAEMKLVLARLIYEFEFEMVNPDFQWDEQRVFTLYEKHPLMLRMKPRGSADRT